MFVEKIRKIVSELPKPALVAIALVILFFLSIPFIVTVLKPAPKKVTPPTPVANNLEQAQQNGTSTSEHFPSLLEAKTKEVELLKKEGKYFSEIKTNTNASSTAATSSSSAPPLPPNLPSFQPATPNLPMPTTEGKTEEKPQEPPHIAYARQIHDKIMNSQAMVGKVISFKKSQNQQEEKTSSLTNSHTNSLTNKNNFDDPRKYLTVGKFYRATIQTTVTSANPDAPIIAILNEGLKGVKLLGRIVGVIEDENRLNVNFEKIVYNNEAYPVRGVAYSLDRTIGVASELQYNILSKILAVGGLAFAESMTQAMREDSETIVSSPQTGNVITQQKASNRLREGMYAGTSSAFGEAKNKVQDYMNRKKDVKIILRENTPILVMFTSLYGN